MASIKLSDPARFRDGVGEPAFVRRERPRSSRRREGSPSPRRAQRSHSNSIATFASTFRSQRANANAAAIALRRDPLPAPAELFRSDQACPPGPNATEGRTARSKKRQDAGLLAYRSNAQRDAREPFRFRSRLNSKRFNF
jgi:hypothetical protein